MIQPIVLATALLVLPLVAAAQRANPSELTGKWAIAIGTPENPEYRSLDAVVGGDGRVRGTIGSPMGSVEIDSGRVAGSRFVVYATLGTGLRLAYDGVVGGDSIRGTWLYDKFEGPFLGLRGTTPPKAVASAPPRTPLGAVDAPLREATIDSLLREISTRYVDTAMVPRVVAAIQARSKSGAYDTLATATSLARALTADLRRFDKHFAVIPVTSGGPPMPPANAHDNYAIKRVERLDGNVGYLKFDMFSLDSTGAAPVLRSALSILARTDALVLDLRDNRGGGGELRQLLLSYLAPHAPRVTADVFIRSGRGFDSTTMQTAARVDSNLIFGNRPLYVLTSARTGSAAEWLAYDLQALGRATVVGEVSAGAAHPIRFVRLNSAFDASIPIGRARSRVTHGDFEGVGVQPDLRAPADQALTVAYGAALRALLAGAADERAKAELERAIAMQSANGRPGATTSNSSAMRP